MDDFKYITRKESFIQPGDGSWLLPQGTLGLKLCHISTVMSYQRQAEGRAHGIQKFQRFQLS